MNLVDRIKQIEDHYAGAGCSCYAYSETECVCGADWRTRSELAKGLVLSFLLEQKNNRNQVPAELLKLCGLGVQIKQK